MLPALWDAVGPQFLAFAISFAIIASYWLANKLSVDLSGTVHSPGDHLCGDQQEQPKQPDDR